jgi:hypothetical protein
MKITLCGSGKFETQFKNWNKRLSLGGHVVYGMSTYASEQGGSKDWFTPEQKLMLDAVHMGKIQNSEAVLILNVGGYIGESTRREMDFAMVQEKDLYFLEIPNPEDGPLGNQIARLARELL